MKTSQNFSPRLLVNQRVGRVTSCAPQFSNAKAARRGLTRPTAPSSSFLFLLSAVLLATSSLLILRPASAHAQGGGPLWTNRYNGPANSDDFVRAIAVDSSGNVFVTGSSASTNEYPYNFDYATIKYSNAGAPLWTNRYNAAAHYLA